MNSFQNMIEVLVNDAVDITGQIGTELKLKWMRLFRRSECKPKKFKIYSVTHLT